MRLLRSRFLQAVLVLVLAFVILRFGIRPPAPRSVLSLYMFIISLAVLVFVSSDRDSWRDFIAPIWSTLVRPERRVLRTVLVIVLPLLMGYYAYTQAAARPQAPPELRAVHPAPPASIQLKGKEFNISGAENPLRKDAARLKEHAAKGGEIYIRNCVYCHGDNLDGKGHFAPGFNPPPANFQDPGTIAMLQEAYLFWRIAKGPAAELLLPKPRDFTRGLYKIRSTVNKTPTDQDLFRIITEGMPGTSMPAWAVLPEKDRHNLVAYIKSFAPEVFKEAPKKLELPKEVSSSEASIKRGKEMFDAIECHKCHGTEGRGDGPSRPELKDEWGHPVAPANLTKRWTFRGGRARTEIATRLANGVLGTPMPAFLEAVEKPEDIWHLTNYIVSLGPDSPQPATLVTVSAVRDAIPDDPGADFWKKITPSNILLEGQVIVDPQIGRA